MRKTVAMLIVLTLLILSACVPETPPPPQGVWQSEYPEIILYIMPEYQIPGSGAFLAMYTEEDGSEVKMIIHFERGTIVSMWSIVGTPQGFLNGVPLVEALLAGSFSVDGNKMRLLLTAPVQEKYGMRSIVFVNVEDYVPINPTNWLPDIFPSIEN